MFYFCPNLNCIKNTPTWTNLKPPEKIIAKTSMSESALELYKQDGLPISI
jgi:hypothetical protein